MENKCQEFTSKQFKVNKALTTIPEYEKLKNEITKLKIIVETFDFEDHHLRDLAEQTSIKELATIKQDGGPFPLKILFDNNIDDFKGDIEDTVTIKIKQMLNLRKLMKNGKLKFSNSNLIKQLKIYNFQIQSQHQKLNQLLKNIQVKFQDLNHKVEI